MIIEKDKEFIDTFANPDDDVGANVHLQSPWLFRLQLDRAKMLDRKLSMNYATGRIAESSETDLFVNRSEDNAEKLIIRCRVLGGGERDEDGLGTIDVDNFLPQLENTMLNSIGLRGIPGIKCIFSTEPYKVYINEQGANLLQLENEVVLETDGVNLEPYHLRPH